MWRDIRGGLNRKGGGAWVETPIPDAPAWYAACLLLRVGDGVTLAEVRVLPDAGRWVSSEPRRQQSPTGSTSWIGQIHETGPWRLVAAA